MGFHKESEMFFFFFCLEPQKYGFQDYSATEEKQHAKYKHSYEQFFLCTTETPDPVQWIEQLYNEDVRQSLIIKLLFNASVAFTDCMLMYAVSIYYRDFEKI